MLDVSAIPIFLDNYVWLLSDGVDAIVVDPGDAAPVITVLARQQLRLAAVLVTHHHPDHIAGIAELLHGRDIPVYGPRAEAAKIKTLTQLLDDGDSIDLLGRKFEIIALPGHTLGHIAYATPGTLLCGDTLFSAGCGRLFEGTPAQMWQSLSRLAALPGDTRVYCTHEYTLSNLAFAAAVEPHNTAVGAHLAEVRLRRASGEPSLPSTVAQELLINPFLRTGNADVIEAASRWCGRSLNSPEQTFAELRRWKDGFRAPTPP